MTKFLSAYKMDNSDANRSKLQAYLLKHPMAVCMLDPTDIAFLREHKFRV